MNTVDNKDIVVFFGAGFSKDLDLPVMSTFGESSEKELENLKNTLKNSPERNFENEFVEAGKIYTAFQSEYAKLEDSLNIDIGNMEEIFCTAEIFQACGITDIKINGDDHDINKLISAIKIWLWKIYHQCPPLSGRTDQKELIIKKYQLFFSFLKENDLFKKSTFITTNYDLLLETFLWDNDIPAAYPDKIAFEEIAAKHDSEAPNEKFIGISNTHESVVLCKLHGSINYFNTEESPDELKIVTDIGVSDKDNVGNLGISKTYSDQMHKKNKRPSIFMNASLSNIKNNFGQDLIPAIIPPTYSKLHQRSWLINIWNEAITAVKNAKLIVFIGYSFPESDGFMKSFFKSAFMYRESNQLPVIINLDKDKNIVCKYCGVFKNISLNNFITGTFSEKADDLINLIRSNY